MDELAVKTEWGEELPINSSMEDFCLYCGVTIIKENDCGWESFREDGVTTQKVCKSCDKENNKIRGKIE